MLYIYMYRVSTRNWISWQSSSSTSWRSNQLCQLSTFQKDQLLFLPHPQIQLQITNTNYNYKYKYKGKKIVLILWKLQWRHKTGIEAGNPLSSTSLTVINQKQHKKWKKMIFFNLMQYIADIDQQETATKIKKKKCWIL